MLDKLGIDDRLLRMSVGIEDVEDLLADLDFDLGNRAVVVLLDLHLVLRHDHTGADVAAAGRAVAHDIGDGLHIHRLLLAAAAREQAEQQHKRQYDRQILCFHCVPPNPEPSEPRGSVCCSFDVAFRKPFRRFFEQIMNYPIFLTASANSSVDSVSALPASQAAATAGSIGRRARTGMLCSFAT